MVNCNVKNIFVKVFISILNSFYRSVPFPSVVMEQNRVRLSHGGKKISGVRKRKSSRCVLNLAYSARWALSKRSGSHVKKTNKLGSGEAETAPLTLFVCLIITQSWVRTVNAGKIFFAQENHLRCCPNFCFTWLLKCFIPLRPIQFAGDGVFSVV